MLGLEWILGQDLPEWIMAEVLRIVEILVAGGDGEDALRQQLTFESCTPNIKERPLSPKGDRGRDFSLTDQVFVYYRFWAKEIPASRDANPRPPACG